MGDCARKLQTESLTGQLLRLANLNPGGVLRYQPCTVDSVGKAWNVALTSTVSKT